MRDRQHSAFTSQDIDRYLNKEMTLEEMHAMEKAALEDPFLADAMEGYTEAAASMEANSFSADVDELRVRLQDRIRQENPDKKVVAFKPNYWWRVAAGIMLLAGTAGIVYTAMNTAGADANEQIAKNERRYKQPADSVITTDTTIPNANTAPVPEDASQGNVTASGALEKTALMSEKPLDENAGHRGNQEAEAKKTDAEVAVADAGERKALVKTESIEQQNRSQKDIAASSAPTSRQQEVLMDQASNNARIYSPFAANNFNGRVVNEDNKPIAGASVIVENKNVGVSTDKDGNFNMILPDSNIKVKIASVGYEPVKLTLKNNLIDNRIVLKQSNAELSEVVVVGYGTQRKRSVAKNAAALKMPVPVIGWDEYETYISKNKRRPAADSLRQGTVIVSFTINKSGKPTNLKIEKSLEGSLDAEALRLIREGPAWKPGKNRTRGRVEVAF